MVEVLEFRSYGEAIGDACAVLRSNAASTGLTAPVPTCPGWRVADLVAHVGVVHRRTADRLHDRPPRDPSRLTAEGMAASDLLEWFDDGMVDLLNALAGAPEDLAVGFFLPDAPAPPRLAWARRMAHETTIHAVDAMAARLGRPPAASELWFGAGFAADGVDELLTGFLPRPGKAVAWPSPERVRVAASDHPSTWLVTLDAAATTSRVTDDPDADVRVSGTARQLYLTLWNRGGEAAASDPGFWRRWAAGVRIGG